MLGRFLHRIGALGPAFQAMLVSDSLSISAMMVGHVALAWWIAQQGGGADLALYAGILAVGALVFLALLSPLGDRYCKRTLMTVSLAIQGSAAAILAMLAHSGAYHLPFIIAADLLGTAASCLYAPASASIVAELLPADQLTTGLGMQKSGQALGRLLGPSLGGAVLAALGTSATLGLYALLMGVSAALTLRIPRRPSTGSALGPTAWLRDIRAGLAAKWHIKVERWWTLVTFLFAIFLFPCIGMLLPLKIQSLGLSSVWLGSCEAALSAGMVIGALGLSARLARRAGRFAAYTVAVVVIGLCFSTIGASHRPVVLLGALALCGLCVSTTQLVGQTHRMLAIPPSFRARMTSVHIMVMQVAATIGPAVGGAGLNHLGVDGVYMLFGFAMLLTAIGYALAPGYRPFISLSHDMVDGYYGRTYPQLFEPQRFG
ncbi:MAG TPA: MFS transporter [Aliidongia sp.]|nr:MFS transporter [Aliidongia sp.]